MADIFGHFTEAGAAVPEHDPGLDAPCPACGRVLERPVVTVSLLVPGDTRSYFYRLHAHCDDPAVQERVESELVDAIARRPDMHAPDFSVN